MPDLPRHTLDIFPVRYPRWLVAAGLAALETEGRIRASSPGTRRRRTPPDSREIGFGRNFGQERSGSVEGHGAIDIFGGHGLPIHATCDGHVVTEFTTGSGTWPGVGYMTPTEDNTRTGGNYLMLRDRAGYHHYYAHMMRKADFEVGQWVRAGTRVGAIGASGLGHHVQHLHYQVTTRSGGVVLHNPYAELVRLAPSASEVSPGGFVRVPIDADFRITREMVGHRLAMTRTRNELRR